MRIRSQIVARGFKSDDRPDLFAGTPPLDALKAIISISARKHCQSCTSMCHVHTFMEKLRDLCWYGYQWRTECAATLGKLVC